MSRLEQIKARIERAKTYGVDPGISLADIEWLIEQNEVLLQQLAHAVADQTARDNP